MDPLSALGLAGNIVTFVDFSWRLITETKAVYQSSTGQPKDALELKSIASDLSLLADNLEVSAARGTSTAGALMRTFAFDCKTVADELQAAIKKLMNDKPNSKWSSFKTALKHVMAQDKLHQLADSITRLQNQLSLRLLSLLEDRQHEMITKLGEITDNDRRLGMVRDVDLQQLKYTLVNFAESLKNRQEASAKRNMDLMNQMDRLQELTRKDGTQRKQQIERLEDELKRCTAATEVSIRDDLRELSDQMKDFAHYTKVVVVEQTVLSSLSFTQIHKRYERVVEAHEATFRWIFDTQFSARPGGSMTFAEWLRSNDSLCWITGKPGCGKSTLMKHLLRSPRTSKELYKWAYGRETEGKGASVHETIQSAANASTESVAQSGSYDGNLLIASYFFWIAGTPLQKSQEGLLRSLLYEVFRQSPEAIPIACNTRRITRANPYVHETEPWTMQELMETFRSLAESSELDSKFCFFIDGLDEYSESSEGSHADLLQLIQGFSACDNFKFCISSREWNVFRDVYLNVNHFILQELTRQDIANYVNQLFKANAHYRRLTKEDSRYSELEQQIVQRAQGVFLWVSLVVRTLLDGMTNADRISDLQAQLLVLPDDLENYFTHIINSVDKRYRLLAAQNLQVANQAILPLRLLNFWYLDEADGDGSNRGEFVPLTDAEIDRYHEDMRRRLNARCKGLLEPVQESTTLPRYFQYNVQYLHRTVRDFLFETSEMQTFFSKQLPEGYRAQRELCKAFVRLLRKIPLCSCGCDAKKIDPPRTGAPQTEKGVGRPDIADYAKLKQMEILKGNGHKPFDEVLFNILMYAQQGHVRFNETYHDVLRDAEEVVMKRPKQWRQGKKTAFIGLAAEFGLHEYVERRLEESPELITSRGRPLLDHVLLRDFSVAVDQLPELPKDLQRLRPEMVQLLLDHDATAYIKYADETVFERFMARLYRDEIKSATQEDLVAVLSILITHERVATKEITVGQEWRNVDSRNPNEYLSSGPYSPGEKEVDLVVPVDAIIQKKFSKAEIDQIIRQVAVCPEQNSSSLLTPWKSWSSKSSSSNEKDRNEGGRSWIGKVAAGSLGWVYKPTMDEGADPLHKVFMKRGRWQNAPHAYRYGAPFVRRGGTSPTRYPLEGFWNGS